MPKQSVTQPTQSVSTIPEQLGICLLLQRPAESMHFLPDGQHILIVDGFGTISIWDIEKRLPIHDTESYFKYPLIQHSAHGNKILVGNRDHNGFGNKFFVWDTADTATTKYIRTFNISYWHNITLSPGGMKLAAQEGNKVSIRFFDDVESGNPIDPPFGAIDKGGVRRSLCLSEGSFGLPMAVYSQLCPHMMLFAYGPLTCPYRLTMTPMVPYLALNSALITPASKLCIHIRNPREIENNPMSGYGIRNHLVGDPADKGILKVVPSSLFR